ncbi:MAG: class I SAM-dependent rRNA methyltransferase, partial [Paracoccaceae bacterium]
MTQNIYPTVRLRPNAAAQAIRQGFPWIYNNEMVLDRRSKKLPAGSVVIVEDCERRPIGLGGINPDSKIAVRMLDRDIEAEIDQTWFLKRLNTALHLREVLFEQPFYRLVHAEADGMPGVIIDRFGSLAVVQPNAAWAEIRLAALSQALLEVEGITCVLKNAGGRSRALEGLDSRNDILIGEPPETTVDVPMNGAVYKADLISGQKTGLYFDQRPNHAFAASLAKGRTVLDVFSHVGGFSLAALAAGAQSALAVDGSAAALDLAMQGAVASGVVEKFETQKGDAFAQLSALAEAGEKFGLVICDPPAFASSKPALEAGLRAYEKVARLAAHLVEEGGFLVLCSCSHAADLVKFRTACNRGIGRAGRSAQLF